MGKPVLAINQNVPAIWRESKPAEVKHPSKRRKRKQTFIPLVAASEEGRAQIPFFNGRLQEDDVGSNPGGEHLDEVWLVETPWKGVPKRVIVP